MPKSGDFPAPALPQRGAIDPQMAPVQAAGAIAGGKAVPPGEALPLVPARTLGGEIVLPGQRRQIDLPVSRLPTGNMLSLPVTVINGRRPGPCLWLSAAIHGDELNGVEIIRRVTRSLQPRYLAGCVLAVPVVNIFGFLEQSRYLPDRRDLNRSFPGSTRGSLAARLAALFMREVVSQCTHGIDLHTAAIHRINLPQIRADLSDPQTYEFARAFGAPVMIHSAMRDGSLRQAAAKCQIPTLLYEGGEALRFDETAIQIGVEGIRRSLAYLKMVGTGTEPSAPSLETRVTKWVRASRGGIWHREVELGQQVEARQRLGFMTDTFGNHPSYLRSPLAGLVVGHSQNPLANQGDALIHIAQVSSAGG